MAPWEHIGAPWSAGLPFWHVWISLFRAAQGKANAELRKREERKQRQHSSRRR